MAGIPSLVRTGERAYRESGWRQENTTKHLFLRIAPIHLGEEAARRSVRMALERLNFRGHLNWRDGMVSVKQSDGRVFQVTLPGLIKEARDAGIPRSLYRWIDLQDEYFGRCIEFATNSKAIEMGVEFAGYSRKLRGPCRFSPMENELTDDVLFYRRAACEASGTTDFAECSRNFRAYLQSAVSLIDAFLNRYVLLLQHADASTVPEGLRGPGRLEERLQTWVRCVARRDPTDLQRGPEWSQFAELRQERNRLVHAAEPYLGIAIRELPRHLNAVRAGVGGLLFRMRDLAGQPTLGFIERLRTAPGVSFKGRK